MKQNRNLRRSQLISPWGVGQMINFPGDESLMVAGLDMWEFIFRDLKHGVEEFILEEDRLAGRLRVKNFRLPPDYRKPQRGVQVANPDIKIPLVRFPGWHYCPRCGSMRKISFFESNRVKCDGYDFGYGLTCKETPRNRRNSLIPVRFITICQDGHIQDFPFMEWVHRNKPFDETHKLRLRAGRSSGALSGIEIRCSCGEKKTLAGAFNDGALQNIGVTCRGERPWLGETEDTAHRCGEDLIVVQKGASNVYFPHVVSSIYLPRWGKDTGRKVIEVLEKNWKFLSQRITEGEFDRSSFEVIAEMYEVDVDELLSAANQRRDGYSETVPDSEERYRYAEYEAVIKEEGSDKQDFFVEKITPDKYGTHLISNEFSNIYLLHKLKETRALTGFSRWLPEDGKSLSERKRTLSLGTSINWLPATIVRGEGVFFEFSKDKINDWMNKTEVMERASILIDNYNRNRINRGLEIRHLNARFLLIHTFAHLVINQFSYECGYGSSALRERIYCNCDSDDIQMNGVLIYTASGDSEGSLGGLVRQGKPGNLERIMVNAIESAKWCSNDPICISSSGQGPGSCNLAACHNCSLLPETSCEESNMLLDRGLLIGSLDNPQIGYFN